MSPPPQKKSAKIVVIQFRLVQMTNGKPLQKSLLFKIFFPFIFQSNSIVLIFLFMVKGSHFVDFFFGGI